MSVRFLVLFPDEWTEVAMASHVLDILRRSHPDAWIGRLIQTSARWISDGYSGWDDTIEYHKTPGEKKNQILDYLPDYLIDLSGNGKFWLFKNRLRLVDFAFSGRAVRIIREEKDIDKRFHKYISESRSLLSVFEPLDHKRLSWETESKDILKKRLPESFLKRYISLNLNDFGDSIDHIIEEIISFLSKLEYPTVLTGNISVRDGGNDISRRVGCTVFNTCGDLELYEMRSVYTSGRILLGRGERLRAWSFLANKESVDLSEDQDIKEIRRKIIKTE